MKKLISVILICALLLTLAACASSSGDDKFYRESDPIQVVDAGGRKVSSGAPIMTVATSWGGGVDAYIHALGVSDRLVATNSKHNLDRKFFNPDEMNKVGRWALDKEALANISPELFLHGAYATEQISGANKVNVRAYGMGFNSFEDIEKNLKDLGALFGVEERADYIISYCNRILELVDTRVSQIPEDKRPTVVVLGDKTGELASDIYDTIEEMTTRAGGISCTPEDLSKKTETTMVGLETIFKWNPDFVFLKDYYCELTVDGIMKDATWAPMTAVKNGNVYALPCEFDGWSTANPSCYMGVLYMSMQMYPDLYEDIDIESTAVEFYREVYGLDMTVEERGFINGAQ